MHRLADGLAQLVAALWVGALWVIGYGAVPILFANLADRAQAGVIAGWLLAMLAKLGIVCGLYLLPYLWWCHARPGRAVSVLAGWGCLVMWLAALVAAIAIQPYLSDLKVQAMPLAVMDSLLRDRFVFWHGVSSTLHLVQSVLGVMLVLALGRPQKDQP